MMTLDFAQVFNNTICCLGLQYYYFYMRITLSCFTNKAVITVLKESGAVWYLNTTVQVKHTGGAAHPKNPRRIVLNLEIPMC